jgi:hypothetical protein
MTISKGEKMKTRFLLVILTTVLVMTCQQPQEEIVKQVDTPFYDPLPITYNNPIDVTIDCITEGAAIYFTTDGSAPSTSSTLFSAPIPVSSTTVIKSFAVMDGMLDSSVSSVTFTLKVASPIFDLSPIVYNNTQKLMMFSMTDGAEIRYTVNGPTPTVDSTLYTVPIDISETTVVKAIGVKAGMIPSSVVTRNYGFKAATPLFIPSPGSYYNGVTISLSCATEGASLYYATIDPAPGVPSTLYTGGISISSDTTIWAIAIATGMTDSDVSSGSYVITHISDPEFDIPPGTYDTPQSVGITTSTPGANIYFTLDGTTPTQGSTLFTTPIQVSTSKTIRAIAIMGGGDQSGIVTGAYTITGDVDVDITVYAQRLMVIDIWSQVSYSNETTKWLVLTITQEGVYYLSWSDSGNGAGGDTVDILTTFFASDKVTIEGGINAVDDGYSTPKSLLLSPGNYYIKCESQTPGVTGTCRIKMYKTW